MNIRKSTRQDLSEILNLYKIAREFMKNNGNPNQWEDRYPEVSTVESEYPMSVKKMAGLWEPLFSLLERNQIML